MYKTPKEFIKLMESLQKKVDVLRSTMREHKKNYMVNCPMKIGEAVNANESKVRGRIINVDSVCLELSRGSWEWVAYGLMYLQSGGLSHKVRGSRRIPIEQNIQLSGNNNGQ